MNVLVYLIFGKLLRTNNFFCLSNEPKINVAIGLRKLLFLYQKIISTVVTEKNIGIEQIPAILNYCKNFYFINNDLFLNNPAIICLEDLKNEKKVEELQNNSLFCQVIDNETLIIIKALKINNGIIGLLSIFAMVLLF